MMSLSVGGYGQGYHHPGPMAHHDLYQYPQMRYPDHTDSSYFQSWVLNAGHDMPVSPESYSMSTPSPTDFGNYESYIVTDHLGHRVVKRRTTANKKERRRTLSINNAFAQLRGCIPNVPSDTKLSKIKTLRLATSYISYLMDVLEKDDHTLTENGFKAEIAKKSSKQLEKEKKLKESSSSEDSNFDTKSIEKKTKGRTGWPQHVWASELK